MTKDDAEGLRRAAELTADEAARLADDAAHGLSRAMPELSAHVVISRPQAAMLTILLAGTAAAACAWPSAVGEASAWLLGAAFVPGLLFRAGLSLIHGVRSSDAPVADAELPVYTILVPLYREANVLPRLARALLLLDYPRDKLDIKIIVEDDDDETQAVAAMLEGRGPFEIVRVPDGKPRTKPRACNYALNFARGEYTVIFDAEDRPQRDQLRRAVAAFASRPAQIACLQARLDFYNARENWQTQLCALDYALWFEVLLPALDRLGVPMPLGGTSNHFRTDVLRRLGGWDPFNVTEDADLGIRIAQLGRRVAMLDSTTFEEAPVHLAGWMRQRSRWLKGYMQTWLVHTRSPFGLLRRAGVKGFVAFHLFIGGAVLAALATLPLWIVTAWSLWHGQGAVALSSLAAGNLALTALSVASPLRRGRRDLSPYGITVMIYWMMISLAALRALCQLAVRPFHWEKTEHGLSRQHRG